MLDLKQLKENIKYHQDIEKRKLKEKPKYTLKLIDHIDSSILCNSHKGIVITRVDNCRDVIPNYFRIIDFAKELEDHYKSLGFDFRSSNLTTFMYEVDISPILNSKEK
jgi:hypothetical protein